MGVGHEELLQPPLEPGRVDMPVRAVAVVMVVVVSLKVPLVCAAFSGSVSVSVFVSVFVFVRVDIVAGMHWPVHAPASVLRLCGAVL